MINNIPDSCNTDEVKTLFLETLRMERRNPIFNGSACIISMFYPLNIPPQKFVTLTNDINNCTEKKARHGLVEIYAERYNKHHISEDMKIRSAVGRSYRQINVEVMFVQDLKFENENMTFNYESRKGDTLVCSFKYETIESSVTGNYKKLTRFKDLKLFFSKNGKSPFELNFGESEVVHLN
jgi:hypothetical protein